MTPEQLKELSDYLNATADLPVNIQVVASQLKEFFAPALEVSPEPEVVSEPAPEVVPVVEEESNG